MKKLFLLLIFAGSLPVPIRGENWYAKFDDIVQRANLTDPLIFEKGDVRDGSPAVYYASSFAHKIRVTDSFFKHSEEAQRFIVAHELGHAQQNQEGTLVAWVEKLSYKFWPDDRYNPSIMAWSRVREKDADLRAVTMLGTARGGIEFFSSHGWRRGTIEAASTVYQSLAGWITTRCAYWITTRCAYNYITQSEKLNLVLIPMILIYGYALSLNEHPMDIQRRAYLREWQAQHEKLAHNR